MTLKSAEGAKGPSLYKRVRLIVAILTGIGAVIGIAWTSIQIYQNFNQPPKPYNYAAAVPGPDCDHGGARWVRAFGIATCLPDGVHAEKMQLRASANDGLGQVYFYGTQHLPNNYRVTVDIDSLSLGACAGVVTRNSDSRKGGYGFEICEDGSWLITKYEAAKDGSGEQVSNLKTSTDTDKVPRASAYHLVAITEGVSLRFTINDQPEKDASDGANGSTDSISLFVAPPDGNNGSVNFENFTFSEIKS
ncbi:MAG TPA: hypothetical protein VH349_00965 [Ktedonobacterales bacterium]|jgi:hypothetical protein